jgi:HNH endonuclease
MFCPKAKTQARAPAVHELFILKIRHPILGRLFIWNQHFIETSVSWEGIVTREEIITAIKECEASLGHVPSCSELKKAKVSKRGVITHFGGYKAALQACDMERAGQGHKISMRTLFLDWADLVRKTGKIPTISEYGLGSKFSIRPLSGRYESWREVPAGMKEFARKEGLDVEWIDVMNVIAAYLEVKSERDKMLGSAMVSTDKPRLLTGEPVYGEALLHPVISHAPTNESGVVFLFGVLAGELGFRIQRIQTEFPDCEAMRQIEPGKWQRVRIEFEYESRNFVRHMHPAAKCDLIVCWQNNWKDCPLEVIELGAVMRGQRLDKPTTEARRHGEESSDRA